MDLAPFIRELILVNESVILRGFGGFETSYKDASYNQNNRKFVPPGKKITFHPDWIIDNGALEHHISETLHLTKTEASQAIDEYVKELFFQLNETGSVELQGIGKFIGSEGKIDSFQLLEDENFLADAFGLDVLEIEIPKPNITQPVIEKTYTPLPKQPRKIRWFVISSILVILAIFTIVLTTSDQLRTKAFQLIGTSKHVNDTSEILIFGAKNNSVEDSITKSISQKIDQSTDARNALHPEEVKVSEPVKEEKIEIVKLSYFYLVAGSFKSKKNAEILSEQLEKKGFFPEIVSTPNNFFHVTIGKYDNKSSAASEKMKFSGQLEQSLWILEK